MILFVVLILTSNNGWHLKKREYMPKYGFRALKYINYLFPKDVVGKRLVRVGNLWDGGYSMLDDFKSIHAAYSFGVGYDWSWDLDLAARGINVFMFDPTITAPKIDNNYLKFYGLGIATVDRPERKMRSLESLLKMDGNWNRKNMILKIDIEGGEYEVLFGLNSSTLEKFSQIVVEFHWMNDVLVSDIKYNMGLSILDKLNLTHQLVWVHPCNYFSPYDIFGGVPFPRTLEVVYVKRAEGMKFEEVKKRNRIDERSDMSSAELLLWWLVGGKGIDFDEIINYYASQELKSNPPLMGLKNSTNK